MKRAGGVRESCAVKRLAPIMFVLSCASPPAETKEVEKAVVEHWRARDKEAVVKLEGVSIQGDRAEARVRLTFPAFHTVGTVKTVKLVRTREGWKVEE